MFVGTTQMRFNVTFSDASGQLNTRVPIKVTLRGESESTNITDTVAKKIAKRYSRELKEAAKSAPANTTVSSAS
jgi:hypothetical protein